MRLISNVSLEQRKPLTIKELSEYFGVSIALLYRLKAKGELSYHKIGKRVIFLQSDIDAFLESCAVSGKERANDR